MPSSSDGAACGAASSSGLLLFQACDESGKAAHPSLVLAEPDGTVRARIDVPEPADIWPTRSGCRAVVRTDAGATFVVDGANGSALRLDLGDRGEALVYQDWAGGGRWGYFSSPDGWPNSHQRAALVDFETGAVTDLRDAHSAEFSPDGETLILVVRPENGGTRGMWLIPADRPRELRKLAIGDDFQGALEFDGERLLYRGCADDWDRLVIASVPAGSQVVVAQARSHPDDWYRLDGWLLHGRPEVAVRFPDRFAVIDFSDGTPRECISVEGKFVTVYLPPNGRGAVLVPSGDNVDQAPRFVDLELGTSRRLVGDAGELVDVLEWGTDDRWLLVSFGGGGYSTSTLGMLDVETGTMAPLPVGNTWRRVSDDGQTLLLDRRGAGNANGCTVIDLGRGSVTELDGQCPDWAVLSPNGRWAAYSERVAGEAERWTLTVVEVATGKTRFSVPGKKPVWLAP